jgi:secernin
VCDTLCALGPDRTLFGKNSDRPVAEPQVVEFYPGRAAGNRLRTTYIEIEDAGAAALLGSRPTWMWGLEHGVNEHRVAIGNEKLYTVEDPRAVEPALVGMDLVRLGLERGADADAALGVMTELLERHGQGGSGEADHDEPYFSSFLVADPASAWVLETSGRRWAARRVDDAAAISNRITLGTDWTRASADLAPGSDVDRWRDRAVPTAIADHRLAATRQCVATGAAALTPGDIVATLRHHGERPWGAPGSDPEDVSPPPTDVFEDLSGITVCMHVRNYQATSASMVAELPRDPDASMRAWVALGSPCAGVYVPVFPPAGVPRELGDRATWERFAALRSRVEGPEGAQDLAEIRSVLAPLESELWEEADARAGDAVQRERFVGAIWPRIEAALAKLGV